jgi:hypothetical protein
MLAKCGDLSLLFGPTLECACTNIGVYVEGVYVEGVYVEE